jgi:uncharacterized protein (TIGR00251 family)
VSKGFITVAKEGILLDLRVSPGAQHTAIEGPYGDSAVKLKVAAPPVKGNANAEVSRFLAALLEVPPSDVAVIRGASSRDKRVLVRGIEEAKAHKALTAHLR